MKRQLLLLLSKARNGEVVNRDTLKFCIDYFVTQGTVSPDAKPDKNKNGSTEWTKSEKCLNFYEEEFEKDYL